MQTFEELPLYFMALEKTQELVNLIFKVYNVTKFKRGRIHKWSKRQSSVISRLYVL